MSSFNCFCPCSFRSISSSPNSINYGSITSSNQCTNSSALYILKPFQGIISHFIFNRGNFQLITLSKKIQTYYGYTHFLSYPLIILALIHLYVLISAPTYFQDMLTGASSLFKMRVTTRLACITEF